MLSFTNISVIFLCNMTSLQANSIIGVHYWLVSHLKVYQDDSGLSVRASRHPLLQGGDKARRPKRLLVLICVLNAVNVYKPTISASCVLNVLICIMLNALVFLA